MIIANPIYDVVFHYLMEDISIAKTLISHIIEKNIIHLEPNPTVIPFKISRNFHVFRMDYAATIKTDEGEEYKVIIEIQKASMIDDILRFRRYLAKQYSAYVKKRVLDKRATQNEQYLKDEKKLTLPIISIYFLGDKLEQVTQPVVHIKRQYYDAITQEPIVEKENFIEQLTHDSYIIQIPYLSEKRRTELEEILAIFDQHYLFDPNKPHVINFPLENNSDIVKRFTQRLFYAQMDEEVEELLRMEEEHYELGEQLQQRSKALAKVKQERERAEKEREEAEKEREEAKKEKDKAEKEREEAKKEKHRAEKEREEAEKEKERLIKLLKASGIDYKKHSKP